MRIGLISAATYRYLNNPLQPGSNHGTAFASTFNGFEESVVSKYDWTFVRSRKRIEDVKVVKVWDREKIWAERLAQACSIPTVCETPEECTEGVDAVILIDDGSAEQSQYAAHPLRKGIPVFCDKPLAMTARKAKQIADLSRNTGTPFMSASSLRFVPDIIKLRDQIPDLGPVHLAQCICGNELIYYGIHALSMVYAVLGPGAVSAVNVGQPGLNIVRIRFADHRDVVLMVGEHDWMRSGYQISVFGKKGWKTIKPDLKDLYWYLLKAFLDYVKTGKESVPIEEEVELIAALEAGKRSLNEQREVSIEEVFEE
ncbi:MAG TPA: Gfo/Idh/MocA family oxidoreductase [Verrucomicrobiales bacterium]|nr:Gfo/Idh/MocA family oxidoreductase [Verrucomicrobiales bacterium]